MCTGFQFRVITSLTSAGPTFIVCRSGRACCMVVTLFTLHNGFFIEYRHRAFVAGHKRRRHKRVLPTYQQSKLNIKP